MIKCACSPLTPKWTPFLFPAPNGILNGRYRARLLQFSANAVLRNSKEENQAYRLSSHICKCDCLIDTLDSLLWNYAARHWRKIATTLPCTSHSRSHSVRGTKMGSISELAGCKRTLSCSWKKRFKVARPLSCLRTATTISPFSQVVCGLITT